MSCFHCLSAGNRWGRDSETGEQCVGCGPQEQFYGCADVAILSGIVDDSPTQGIRRHS